MPRAALVSLVFAVTLSACGSHEPATQESPDEATQDPPVEEAPEPTPEPEPVEEEAPPPDLPRVLSGQRSGSTGDRLVTPVCAARVVCGCYPRPNAAGPHCVVGEATGASGWASHFERDSREELSCSRRCEGEQCHWVCDPSTVCTRSCDASAPAPYHCEQNPAGDCVRVDH